MKHGIITILLTAVLATGCYTKFGYVSVDRQVVPDPPMRDTRQRDTVYLRDNEICVAYRTVSGSYLLKCRPVVYNAGWDSWYSSPWWQNCHAFEGSCRHGCNHGRHRDHYGYRHGHKRHPYRERHTGHPSTRPSPSPSTSKPVKKRPLRPVPSLSTSGRSKSTSQSITKNDTIRPGSGSSDTASSHDSLEKANEEIVSESEPIAEESEEKDSSIPIRRRKTRRW